MSLFTLHLLAADRGEVIENVASFNGEDTSGRFGILAHHERFLTTLDFGLARLRLGDGSQVYLGLPGGVLYFVDNTLRISTRRYLRDTDVTRIGQALTREMLEEEQALAGIKHKLHMLEAEMMRRLAFLEQP